MTDGPRRRRSSVALATLIALPFAFAGHFLLGPLVGAWPGSLLAILAGTALASWHQGLREPWQWLVVGVGSFILCWTIMAREAVPSGQMLVLVNTIRRIGRILRTEDAVAEHWARIGSPREAARAGRRLRHAQRGTATTAKGVLSTPKVS